MQNVDTTAPKAIVRVANGKKVTSIATATLPIPQLARDFPTTGHVMPSFQHTLIGLGPICDAGCTVNFTTHNVTVLSPTDVPILSGWRESGGT